VLGHPAALRVLGLGEDRFRQWKRRELACALDDALPCPRTFPNRLRREERSAMRDLVRRALPASAQELG
jgi:hypothetical protein